MESWRAEVVILGSGFAGSLAAMILKRLDLRPVVIDKASHPRFAIGESSTPIADAVLLDLAERYDLTRLAPLAKYGPWQATYPQITCGRKRGFSYFPHTPGEPFSPRADHANELLVAASLDDEHSDTHWLRADVDQFLAREVERMEIPLLQQTEIREVQVDSAAGAQGGWTLRGQRGGQPLEVRADFVIDATGEATVIPRALGVRSQPDVLLTHSRGLFSHWTGVGAWHDWLDDHDGAVADHPFSCDDAAQHHVLDGAWMWLLRFNNGVTSAGLAIDPRRWPEDPAVSPEAEWQQWLKRFPSVGDLLRDARIADPPGKIIRTGRLQRCVHQAAGRNWALLPHTAGFVDPLHSSGIAHSLWGVERLMKIIEAHWGRDTLVDKLRTYEQVLFSELSLIDQLVAGCYSSFRHFRLMVAYSMLYFAAATTSERRRAERGYEADQQFLLAGDAPFRQIVQATGRRLSELVGTPLGSSLAANDARYRSPSAAEIAEFESSVARALEPFNWAGLCDSRVQNMYRYTAAPQR